MAAPPKSAAARLLADATTAGRAPWLLQLALPVLQWVLLGAGAVIALGVFLLGCLDLRSHPSGLYVAAFMKHYRWPVPPSNIAWVSPDPAVRRYMAEALAKVKAASKRK